MTSLTYFITFVFDNSENFCKRFSTDISQRLSAKGSRYNTLNFCIFISFPSIFLTFQSATFLWTSNSWILSLTTIRLRHCHNPRFLLAIMQRTFYYIHYIARNLSSGRFNHYSDQAGQWCDRLKNIINAACGRTTKKKAFFEHVRLHVLVRSLLCSRNFCLQRARFTLR